MKTGTRLLSAGALVILTLAATLARGSDMPMRVINLTGGLRIQLSVPCGDAIDQTAAVNGGGLELTPSEGILTRAGGRFFTLTRASVSFAPFAITGSCFGLSQTRTYLETRMQLARAVSFTAVPTSTPDEFSIVIPKDQFLIYYVTVGNESPAYKYPIEDVTGTMNLAAGTLRMRAVFATRVDFSACTALGCPDAAVRPGTMTATIAGTIAFPDTDRDGVPDRTDNCRFVANADQSAVATPQIVPPPDVTLSSCLDRAIGVAFATDRCDGGPVTVTNDAPALFTAGPNTVTWTARDALGRTASATQIVTIADAKPAVSCTANHSPGHSFTVSAQDGCTPSPIIRLGSVVLTDGETIVITETGNPGVRLVNRLGPAGIRHFHVGRGEGVVTATDESGNVGSIACAVRR